MGSGTQKPVAETETIIGVLIPSGWCEDFKVTSISLACDGEREIVIHNLDTYPTMFAHLRKRVRVTGKVFREGQNEVIDVSSFGPLDETEIEDMEPKGVSHDENM